MSDFEKRGEEFKAALERLQKEYSVLLGAIPVITPVQFGNQIINTIDARLNLLDATEALSQQPPQS